MLWSYLFSQSESVEKQKTKNEKDENMDDSGLMLLRGMGLIV